MFAQAYILMDTEYLLAFHNFISQYIYMCYSLQLNELMKSERKETDAVEIKNE